MSEIIKAAAALREQRDEKDAALNETHLDMVLEFDRANKSGAGRYGLNNIKAFWEFAGNRPPPTSECVSFSLDLMGRIACSIPPRRGENPDQYVSRVAELISRLGREGKLK